MTSRYIADQRPALRPLRRLLRRMSRSYALVCAREDARRLGFVVPSRLPVQPRLQSFYD